MPKPGLPKKYAKMGFKKGWREFKAAKRRRSSTRKGGVRKTARRAYKPKNNPKKNNNNRRNMKGIPHPSVTGMASGLAIAAYLNAGTTTQTKKGFSTVTTFGEGVIKDVTDGQLGLAFNTLSQNAINMIASDAGRKTLVTAGSVALLGAAVRSRFPQLKLGGSKLYFRI